MNMLEIEYNNDSNNDNNNNNDDREGEQYNIIKV